MVDNFIQIGDIVYSSRDKVIGLVVDKIIKQDDENIYVHINIDKEKSQNAFNIEYRMDNIEVKMESIKKLNPLSIYRFKKDDNIEFSNLLKEKDISEGNLVKVVDNYFLEKILSYKDSDRLFTAISLKDISNKNDEGGFKLTGESIVLSNDLRAVQIKYDEYNNYNIYIDCLQLHKRVNIFKKILYKIFKLKTKWFVVVISIIFLLISLGIPLIIYCFGKIIKLLI